jgi:hypothetical protein
MATSESAVGFHRIGGHKHDGKDSTKIDFSAYDEDDLVDLVKKVQKALPGNEGGEDDPAVEGIPVVEGIPLSGVVSAPVNLGLTTGQNVNGTSWVRVTWDSPTDTAADAGSVTTLTDDEANSYDGEVENTAPVFYEGSVEGIDDTDTVDVTEVITQSVDTTIEYQVSYGRTSEFASTDKRTFLVTDQQDIQIRGLTTGVDYTFRIRGINRIGVKSDSYLEGTITTTANADAPAAPTGLSLVMGYDTATLTWTPTTTVHSVGANIMTKVEVSIASDFSSIFATREVAGTTLTITGLDHLTTYYFRAKTKSATGVYSSSWSSTASGTTVHIPGSDVTDGSAPSTSPSLAASGSVVGGPNYFRVKWSAVSNADTVYYDVHMGTTSGFTPSGSTLCTTTPGLSTFIKKLPDGTTDIAYDTNYYFKIIAKDNDGSAAAGTVSSASQLLRLDGGADIVANSITANELAVTAITTEAIASSDFATGVAGWQIHGDGSAEFNDVTVRGDIVTSSITATRTDNKITNGAFESNVSGWTINNAVAMSLSTVNDYLALPDTAIADITGDLDIAVRVQLSDYTTTGYKYLIGKWNETGNQRSYILAIDPSGNIVLATSTDGTVAGQLVHTSAAPSFVDGTAYWIRATIDVNNGSGSRVVKFYKSTSVVATSWVQIGTTQTIAGTTSIYNSSADLRMGNMGGYVASASATVGSLFGFYAYAGYDGASSTGPYGTFQDGWSEIDNVFTDYQGYEYTLTGASTVDSATITRDTGTFRTGVASMKVDPHESGTLVSLLSNPVEAVEGDAWAANAWFTSSSISTALAYLTIRYYNSSDELISTSIINELPSFNSSEWSASDDNFYLRNYTYSIAPAGTTYLYVEVTLVPSSTENLFMDDAELYRVPQLEGLVLTDAAIQRYDYADATIIPGGVVGFTGYSSDSTSTSGTTSLAVHTLLDVKLEAGRAYKFTCHGRSVRMTDSGAVFEVRIQVGSTTIVSTRVTAGAADFRAPLDLIGIYKPDTDVTDDINVYLQRTSGAGTAMTTGDSGVYLNGQFLLVEDIGTYSA